MRERWGGWGAQNISSHAMRGRKKQNQATPPLFSSQPSGSHPNFKKEEEERGKEIKIYDLQPLLTYSSYHQSLLVHTVAHLRTEGGECPLF